MADPRVDQMAKILINYSLAIKPGDKLMVRSDSAAAPLVDAVFREAIRAGAHIFTRIELPHLAEIRYRESSDEQLTYVSELEKLEIETIDAYLHIVGEENTKALSNVDPKRLAMRRAARKDLTQRFDERFEAGDLRWCVTVFPTQAHAQDASMSLSEYETFVFNACLLDKDDPVELWQQVGAENERIARYLMQHDEIHIVAPDTDITYRVGGRKWISAHGKENFPDGEVFTAPIEDSVNGTVRFTYPAIYGGRSAEDIRLAFRDGVVVEAAAAKGQEFLLAMLDTDAGARRLGEVAFGTNYGIQQFTGNLLFDEKIGGTMHMALGAAYKDSGGTNESGLHWDIVCDLREGRVYADGELCYENGKFII